MRRLPRYDEPLLGDEISLCDADGRPNGLSSKVQTCVASAFDEDKHEVRDNQGRMLYVERAGPESWRQIFLRS